VDLSFAISTEASAYIGSRQSRLVRFQGEFFGYVRGCGYYREESEELLRAGIRKASKEYKLTPSAVNAAIDEIKSVCIVDHHSVTAPFVMDVPGTPSVPHLISCRNGILDPQPRTLYDHDERLFTLNALPFGYDPTATAPRWHQFLGETFDNDRESIGELQKVFGYLLTADTRLQKIFTIIGPKRSGKGTIGRALQGLLGAENIASPTFSNLGSDFGLEGLIGKRAAIIADARLGTRADRVAVSEVLLNVSGEDSINVRRKRRTDWCGKLDARIVILSNELPALPDPSGALAGRYIVFHTPVSFFGREDHGLTDKLLTELPGILNWALDGLQRLAAGERITTPAMARDLLEEIDALGSPVKAFVTERCTFGSTDLTVKKDDLWAAYRLWHLQSGIVGQPLSKEMFSRALKTAFAGVVKDYRPRLTDGARPTSWAGLTLTTNPDQTQHPPSSTHHNAPFGHPVVNTRSN